jgi:hypothetical protein
MKRSRRFTLRRIAFALAVAAVFPALVQAKPTPAKHNQESTVEIPYLSHGGRIAPTPDDRSFSKATNVDSTPALVDSGSDNDLAAVGGFALVLVLVAGGGAFAIRHNRRTKLSPA